MKQTKYIIARNDFSANYMLKKIYSGKVRPESVLFDRRHDAVKRLRKMRLVKQEEYSIFSHEFNPNAIRRYS